MHISQLNKRIKEAGNEEQWQMLQRHTLDVEGWMAEGILGGDKEESMAAIRLLQLLNTYLIGIGPSARSVRGMQRDIELILARALPLEHKLMHDGTRLIRHIPDIAMELIEYGDPFWSPKRNDYGSDTALSDDAVPLFFSLSLGEKIASYDLVLATASNIFMAVDVDIIERLSNNALLCVGTVKHYNIHRRPTPGKHTAKDADTSWLAPYARVVMNCTREERPYGFELVHYLYKE